MAKKKYRKQIPFLVREFVFRRDNYRCNICGASSEDVMLHIDHINPVANGGTDELENLMTLCEECNLGKSDFIISKLDKHPVDREMPLSELLDHQTEEINRITNVLKRYGQEQRRKQGKKVYA